MVSLWEQVDDGIVSSLRRFPAVLVVKISFPDKQVRFSQVSRSFLFLRISNFFCNVESNRICLEIWMFFEFGRTVSVRQIFELNRKQNCYLYDNCQNEWENRYKYFVSKKLIRISKFFRSIEIQFLQSLHWSRRATDTWAIRTFQTLYKRGTFTLITDSNYNRPAVHAVVSRLTYLSNNQSIFVRWTNC